MWKCKKCGGEVIAKVVLEEALIGAENILYYYCTHCDNHSEKGGGVDELEKIAEYIG